MSKIGNYRVGLQESDNYRFGWLSAERGEPLPIWHAETHEHRERLASQRLGWNDYYYAQRLDVLPVGEL